MASTHTRTFRPRVFPADQMACWDRYCELVGSLASPAGTYVTLAAFPVDGADLPPGGAAAALPPPLDTVAEAPMTSPVTVQDVMNRPSPPHEPFAEQARGAPIEDEFEQHWNATETSETHFFTDGTWLPKYI